MAQTCRISRVVALVLILIAPRAFGQDDAPREFGGVYPHLAFFNNENECGIGAVVSWANRLWTITYGPHSPNGSSDKLYEIDAALNQTAREESVGGTNANRMIHRESNQLFIGNHAIDADGNVRTIPHKSAPGRITAVARSLTDPAEKVYWLTMEEGLYEIDVESLEPREIYQDGNVGGKVDVDILPGYHGKGGYTSQGRVVYANNGEYSDEARRDPTIASGCLAEWFGEDQGWRVVERKQFTEVTTKDGIYGGLTGEEPLWSLGWDSKSVILAVLDGGEWRRYRLPKASHCYDGAHGWNTEWPRIRKIDEEKDYLATMHGTFWRFPSDFSASNARGIRPRSTYLKVIGDFEYWQNRVVFGCDDSAKSEFLNSSPFKNKIQASAYSNSNLWFVAPEKLDAFGPALGRGALWLRETVEAGVPSDPYLFDGYDRRSCFLRYDVSQTVAKDGVAIQLEIDEKGTGEWRVFKTIRLTPDEARRGCWRDLDDAPRAEWLRIRSVGATLENATFILQYRNGEKRGTNPDAIFNGLASGDATSFLGARFWTRSDNKRLAIASQRVENGAIAKESYFELSESGELEKVESKYEGGESGTLERLKNMVGATEIAPDVCTVDELSALVHYRGRPYRLPIGSEAVARTSSPLVCRLDREVSTERDLFHCAGTFYELPAENAGGLPKIRPISTSDKLIVDYASYRGMLVMSGLAASRAADESDRVARSDDDACAVWRGAIDDLWSLGKPVGRGAVWRETKVETNVPSDPMLATGFDRKRVEITNHTNKPVVVALDADATGDDEWIQSFEILVPANDVATLQLPDSFQAYWLRLRAEAATLSATFIYE